MALTKLQKTIVVTLIDGGVLRRHIKPNDAHCWRLLNHEYKPLRNLPEATVSLLFNRNYIQRTEAGIKAGVGVYKSRTGRVYNRAINQ